MGKYGMLGLIGAGLLVAADGAFAMDEKVMDLVGAELIAVAIGDLDCSGRPTVASLYEDKEGILLVELALQAPTEGIEPYGPAEGATVAFGEPDKDGCQAIELTDALGDAVVVHGRETAELADLLVKAGDTAGDEFPDAHVMLKKPLSLPGDIQFGLSITPCDWDNYCWDDGCSNACFAYGVISVTVCGTFPDGSLKYCTKWGCTHWKQHCIGTGW